MEQAKKLTRSQALRICREGWRELAKNGDEVKPKLFSSYYHNCPLCEYVRYVSPYDPRDHIGCPIYCPLIWPGREKTCKGLYEDWCQLCITKKERKALALQIANLPRKPIPKKEKNGKRK